MDLSGAKRRAHGDAWGHMRIGPVPKTVGAGASDGHWTSVGSMAGSSNCLAKVPAQTRRGYTRDDLHVIAPISRNTATSDGVMSCRENGNLAGPIPRRVYTRATDTRGRATPYPSIPLVRPPHEKRDNLVDWRAGRCPTLTDRLDQRNSSVPTLTIVDAPAKAGAHKLGTFLSQLSGMTEWSHRTPSSR